MPKIEEPMNPYAEEDFKNAIAEATKKLNEALEKSRKQIRFNLNDVSHIHFTPIDDDEEYCGTMRLPTSALWESLVDTLIDNGYEVTVRKEDATETEREVDGADKFVVIEYEEVE